MLNYFVLTQCVFLGRIVSVHCLSLAARGNNSLPVRPWKFLSILNEEKTVSSLSVRVIGHVVSRQLDSLCSPEDVS